MLVTGIVQLISAPLAAFLEVRVDARLLAACGYGAFALGCAMSAFDTRDTDFNEMILPQIVRGAAIMFCILPPTYIALGRLPRERVPDASGLFNLMRNLGGAIGIALIDTVLYGRAPMHADALVAGLKAGDAAAAASVGLPADLVAAQAGQPPDPATLAFVQPLIETAAFAQAINEAWMMLAALVAVGLISLPFTPAVRSATDRDHGNRHG